ncbi:hypothetical protein ACFL6A_00060 [bacterium]
MRKRNSKTSKDTKPKKRFRRYLFRAFLVLAGLFLCAYLVLIFFPSEKMGILFTKHVSRMAGRSISAERVSFLPFGGIEIQALHVPLTETDGFQQDSYFRIEKLGIRFSLLPLIIRQMDIREILIEKPVIHVISLPPDKEKGKEEQKIPSKSVHTDGKSADTPDSSAQALKPLPISVGLFRLLLQDFRLSVRLPQIEGDIETILEGVHLDVSDLRLPRKYNASSEGIQGKIHFYCEDGQVRVKTNNTKLDLRTQFQVTAHWEKDADWNLKVNLNVQPASDTDQSNLRFTLGLRGKGYGENLVMAQTGLTIDNQQIIRMEGNCTQLGPDAQFHLNLEGDVLNIGDLFTSLGHYLSEEQLESIQQFWTDGQFQIIQGEVLGSPRHIRFTLQSNLKGGELRDQMTGLRTEDINVSFNSEGVITKKGIEDGRLSGDFIIGSVHYALNDTASVDLRQIAFHLVSELDSSGIPHKGRVRGSIAHLFEGSMDVNFNWSLESDSVLRVDKAILLGEVQLDTLDVDALPWSPAGINGNVTISGKLALNGLQNIHVQSDVFSSSISYSLSESVNGTLPLHVTAQAFLKTDGLEEVILDSSLLAVNDFLSTHVRGDYDLLEKRFNFTIDGEIRNDNLSEYIPGGMVEQLGDIKLRGKELFSFNTRGYMIEDSLAISADAELRLLDVSLEYPGKGIKMDGVGGFVGLSGSPGRLQGQLKVDLDTVSYTSLRSEPLSGMGLEAAWNLQNDSLWVEKGELAIESMGLNGDFSLNLGRLKMSPDISALLTVGYQSEDTIEVIQGVSLNGDWTFQAAIETENPEKQRYRASGYVSMDSLHVDGTQLKVHDINGKVPFQMNIDLQQMAILVDETSQVRDWLDYESQREIYQNLIPTLGNITIREILVSGNRIQNVILDLEAQSGKIQIPWFYMQVLDGNVGGSLTIDLNSGKLNDISYSMRANASRINSAALTNTRSQDSEETELNVSFAFQGKGADIDQDIDLDGYFHLTQMGPKFARTLLEFMDPQGTDRSIQLTRKLLKTGWKPKLFSFELRHGYVYPVLSLSQPWFSPIRIPGTLKYGRLPLEFFIKQQLAKSQ